MIINHKHKFIFLKTRKTAGTSIEIALSQFCSDPDDIITPISPEDEIMRQQLGYRGPQNYNIPLRYYRLSDWIGLFKNRHRMCFFNHAPAWYVRRYLGKAIWDGYFKFCFERNPFDKAISRYFWITQKKDLAGLEYFLESASPNLLSDWDMYTIDDNIAVDFVGRYENLVEDMKTVTKKIGLSMELKLPRAKANYRQDRRHYSKIINSKSQFLIEQTCAAEIAMFSYQWTD